MVYIASEAAPFTAMTEPFVLEALETEEKELPTPSVLMGQLATDGVGLGT
jgi:hypothetical protein